METWYEIEYIYNRPGSDKIAYKGLKGFKSLNLAEKFAAVVYCLSQKDKALYDTRQLQVSQEYLGQGKFVALKKFCKCTKKEIKLQVDD